MSKKKRDAKAEGRAKRTLEVATTEVQECRKDMAEVFLGKWAPRGVTPVNGAIALCLQFAIVVRRVGASKEEIHAMLDEVLVSADEEIERFNGDG